MKVDIQTDFPLAQSREQMVGNVYPVRGGFGARNGHMHIIIAATEKVIGDELNATARAVTSGLIQNARVGGVERASVVDGFDLGGIENEEFVHVVG